MAYDTYPLAFACLPPTGLTPWEAEIELYERLTTVWETVRPLDAPEMIDIMPYLVRYMQRFKSELLDEFGKRLDNIEEAVSFEYFIIEKILEDPRFRGTSN